MPLALPADPTAPRLPDPPPAAGPVSARLASEAVKAESLQQRDLKLEVGRSPPGRSPAHSIAGQNSCSPSPAHMPQQSSPAHHHQLQSNMERNMAFNPGHQNPFQNVYQHGMGKCLLLLICFKIYLLNCIFQVSKCPQVSRCLQGSICLPCGSLLTEPCRLSVAFRHHHQARNFHIDDQ